jgi:hypothetical protein
MQPANAQVKDTCLVRFPERTPLQPLRGRQRKVHVCVLENDDIWSAETQIDRRAADFDAMQRENDHPVTGRN